MDRGHIRIRRGAEFLDQSQRWLQQFRALTSNAQHLHQQAQTQRSGDAGDGHSGGGGLRGGNLGLKLG